MVDKNIFAEFVADNNWIFAKTYADRAPHEYVVKDKLDDRYRELFPELVIYIRENGFPAFFGNKEHVYLYYDKHYYWTMGDPVEDTVIINRCRYDDYRINTRRDGISKIFQPYFH